MKRIFVAVFMLMLILMALSCCKESGFVPLEPANLGKMLTLVYEYGSFNGGQCDFSITREKDDSGKESIHFLAKGSNGVEMDADYEIEQNVLDEIAKIIVDYGIFEWHGFSGRNNDILDGYGFRLAADFENGSLTANGYMKKPKGYDEGHKALSEYLTALAYSQAAELNEPFSQISLFAYIDASIEGDSTPCADFAENFKSNFPVSVSVLYQNVGGGQPYTVTDEKMIRDVFEALKNIEVVEENGMAHTDDYLTYYFTMADNSSIQFTFQSGCYIGRRDNLLSLTGFGALSAALDYPPDWEPPEVIRPLYVNERLGFEIELFENWEACETEGGAVEIIGPRDSSKETTTNLIIERIEGCTAEQLADKAKKESLFGSVTKSKDKVWISTIGGNGVTLEFEKPGPDGLTLWTNAQFANDNKGNCYLIYYTTIHKDDGRSTWFGGNANSIIYTFRLL